MLRGHWFALTGSYIWSWSWTLQCRPGYGVQEYRLRATTAGLQSDCTVQYRGLGTGYSVTSFWSESKPYLIVRAPVYQPQLALIIILLEIYTYTYSTYTYAHAYAYPYANARAYAYANAYAYACTYTGTHT